MGALCWVIIQAWGGVRWLCESTLEFGLHTEWFVASIRRLVSWRLGGVIWCCCQTNWWHSVCSCYVQWLRVVWALAAGLYSVVKVGWRSRCTRVVSSEQLVALQAFLWCLNVQRLGPRSSKLSGDCGAGVVMLVDDTSGSCWHQWLLDSWARCGAWAGCRCHTESEVWLQLFFVRWVAMSRGLPCFWWSIEPKCWKLVVRGVEEASLVCTSAPLFVT